MVACYGQLRDVAQRIPGQLAGIPAGTVVWGSRFKSYQYQFRRRPALREVHCLGTGNTKGYRYVVHNAVEEK